ncbi:EamA family transporter [Acidithiobacillus sp. IBUN Pt1247-S3]|uniref:EamA family transporter n=1 Tax=Acidithiobacillus sp. IBUN Pt1247-S3 TaxID=3166642 RepID=UPI0034E3E3A0
MMIPPLRFAQLEVPLWVPVTLFAALMQTWRTGLQTRLKGTLSVDAASFVRYLYALPLEFLALLVLLLRFGDEPFAGTGLPFLFFCLAGGVAQILGTLFLVRSFHSRGLVAGTAYAKTEAAQLVILTVLFLGAEIQALAVLGIALAFVGVLLLSGQGFALLRRDFWRGLREPAARYGLAAALSFALAAIALRAASRHGDPQLPLLALGLWMLIVTNTLQTLLQGSWLLLRKPDDLRASLQQWRVAWPVGVLSALGSWAWFSGFALTQVALVRGLGQVDTLLVFFFGHKILKERLGKAEIVATLLIVLGALCIVAPDIHWHG